MRTMMSEEKMKSRLLIANKPLTSIILVLVALCCVLPMMSVAQAQTQPTTKPAAATQKGFDTPQAAAEALTKAAGDFDVPELLAILGPDGHDLVASGDQVEDKNNAQAFAKEAAAKNSIQIAKSNPNRATIIVGEGEWPAPIPLVKKSGKWYFNTKEGRQEILFRRIGENELNAITVCRGYVSAQKEYASDIHDDSGVNQYAQKIISTPGKQDGLFWKNADGTPDGPIGEAVANALAEGYTSGKGGFHGYYFKILKGQGPAAPMGKLNYVIEGIMIGGFALVAVPAEYRVTGVKTFIVSNDGIVYQKDLGPDSLKIAKEMELYNPDKTWQPTDDEWPQNVATANP
ncbi:MAG TPA: DUF2950 domain-containing protein [Terriglobales bacterium]